MKKGVLFIIDGPSGSGKDTIINELVISMPNLIKARNYTDRAPRPNESADAYFFITPLEFDRLLETGEIFEWEHPRNTTARYGSSTKEVIGNLSKGKNVIKVVGVQKHDFFKEKFGNQAVSIFIKPDDLKNLKKRLSKAYPGLSKEDLEIRCDNALDKLKHENKYDYSVINPEGHPEKAIEEIKNIFNEELTCQA